MPTPTIPASAKQTNLSGDPSAEHDGFIDARIETTRSHVKLIELATNLAIMAAGVLGFLLLATLIDHWVWGLNLWARLVALVILIVGCAVFFVIKVLPCLLRPVNPVYAAHTIEQAAPELKNSLINFLLLRSADSGVRRVVFDGVRRQAASGLSQVDVDVAVDRSILIRVGYVLATLVVILGLYKILSPKDPFRSVARIAAPWRPIARPSRTRIEQIEPGNVEIYQGMSLDVSANVQGLDRDEAVALRFSTADGQVVDQVISMTAPENAHRYEGEVSFGPTGIQQDLTYYIQAGDARTEDYRVTVRDAPSIHVQRVTYQYPSYTGLPDQTVDDIGDLTAVEGTRVRIDALANHPIRSAYLELFDPSSEDPSKPVKSVPMIHEGPSAKGQITLTLRTDRTTPMYSGYQLRFKNSEGRKNDRPARYQIEVTPDLPPLIEIVAPRRREVELPVNRPLFVEVRALDPDYGLRRVRLHAVSGGLELLKTPLLDDEHQGQAIVNYQLVPSELGLAAGDTLVYWAEAEDNRRAAGSNAADPNVRRTDNFRIRVVPPDDTTDGKQPNEDREGSPDGENADRSQDGDSQQSGGQGGSDSSEASDASGEGDASRGAENPNAQNSSDPSESEPDMPADGQQASPEGDAGDPSNPDNSGQGREGSSDPNQNPSDAIPESETRGDGEPRGEEEPVASDGSNDAEAFERILDEMRNDEGAQDPTSTDRPSESDQADEPSDPSDSNAGDENADAVTDDERQGSEPAGARRPQGRDGSASPEKDEQDGTRQDGSRQDDTTAEEGQPEDGTGRDETGRDETDETGRDETGAGGARGDDPAQDRDEQGAAGRDGTQERDRGSGDSASESDRPSSDARPQDHSQDASEPRPRNDSADPAGRDERNHSEESQGEPASSASPGRRNRDDSQSADRDASDRDSVDPSGSNPGSDSSSGDSAPDASTGDDSDDAPQSRDSDAQTESSEGSDSNSAETSDGESNGQGNPSDRPNPRGGREAGNGQDAEAFDETDDTADDPNLEYTRKATDLALEYLKDRQDDGEVLERLGWTPDEVRDFLLRWQQMRQDARQQGVRGQRSRQDLDDRLKGLGLRPAGARTRRVTSPDGELEVGADGSRSAPPPEYRDQFRAFQKSFSGNRREK